MKGHLWAALLPILILQCVTAIGLIVAVAWFSYEFPDDRLTPVMIAIVGSVWAAYALRGVVWAWQRPSVPEEDEPEAGSLAAEARERALAQAVTFGGVRRLHIGASDALVQDLGDRPGRGNLPLSLSTGQAVLISLGLVGTFLGLTVGLVEAVPRLQGDEQAVKEGMRSLLDGAMLAFAKSLAGVWCGVVWSVLYRRLEEEQAEMLHELKDWLDARFAPLSSEQILIHYLSQQQATLGDLLKEVDRVPTVLAAERGQLAKSMTDERVLLGQGVAQVVNEATTRGIRETSDMINQLAEALPEKVSSNALGVLQKGLQPSFDEISAALKNLAAAGGQAIGDAVKGSVATEVDKLRMSLGEIASVMEQLGPRVTSQLDEADARVQQGANAAAVALTEAGHRASEGLRAAASEIGAEAAEVEGRVEAIRAALTETGRIADALRGAGAEVSDKLRDVARPLSDIAPRLEVARTSIEAASAGFNRGREAADALTDKAARLTASLADAVRAQEALVARAVELTSRVEELRLACEATIRALDAATHDRQAVGSEANRQLAEAVAHFAASLESAQQNVAQASTNTFAGAQAVTTDAAKQMAEILTRAAGVLDDTMERMAAHSNELERGLAAAREAAGALEVQARGISAVAAEASRPFGDVAVSLGEVAPQVRLASQALQTEREALTMLGGTLRAQSDQQRESSQQLGERIREYQALQARLSGEWAKHVEGIDKVLDRVENAWSQAINATNDGIAKNADQIANYAQQVEKSIRLPRDIRELNETLTQLTETLQEMRSVLGAKA